MCKKPKPNFYHSSIVPHIHVFILLVNQSLLLVITSNEFSVFQGINMMGPRRLLFLATTREHTIAIAICYHSSKVINECLKISNLKLQSEE